MKGMSSARIQPLPTQLQDNQPAAVRRHTQFCSCISIASDMLFPVKKEH